MANGRKAGHVEPMAQTTTPMTAIASTVRPTADGVVVARRSRRAAHSIRARSRASARAVAAWAVTTAADDAEVALAVAEDREPGTRSIEEMMPRQRPSGTSSPPDDVGPDAGSSAA